jgi:hypothetical protein
MLHVVTTTFLLSNNFLNPLCFVIGAAVAYDPATDPNFPFNYAISAGVNFDGTIAYPALAYAVNCPLFPGAINAISRVTTNPATAAAYLSCFNDTQSYEFRSNISIYMFPDTIAVSWKKTNLTSVSSLPGFCGFLDILEWVTFGRYQMNNWTMIGRVNVCLN